MSTPPALADGAPLVVGEVLVGYRLLRSKVLTRFSWFNIVRLIGTALLGYSVVRAVVDPDLIALWSGCAGATMCLLPEVLTLLTRIGRRADLAEPFHVELRETGIHVRWGHTNASLSPELYYAVAIERRFWVMRETPNKAFVIPRAALSERDQAYVDHSILAAHALAASKRRLDPDDPRNWISREKLRGSMRS